MCILCAFYLFVCLISFSSTWVALSGANLDEKHNLLIQGRMQIFIFLERFINNSLFLSVSGAGSTGTVCRHTCSIYWSVHIQERFNYSGICIICCLLLFAAHIFALRFVLNSLFNFRILGALRHRAMVATPNPIRIIFRVSRLKK